AFEAAVADPAYNRLYLTYASSAEERFFGFGEQFSAFDLKGRRLPILVQEQGIGRGAQPVTTIVDLVAGAGGAWHTSYAPVPHYITSQLRSLFLENYEYAIFDLRRDDRVQIALFATEMRGRILNGDSPTKLIETYTSYTGRMRPLPDWINQGAVVGLQGGTARVEAIWAALQRHQVPISAFWLQDWVGQRTTSFGQQLWWNWELDRQRYPAWERLLADLGAADIRVMLYASPFLADVSDKPNHRRNLFAEAAAQGFLVRQEDGQPYLIQNTDFSAGLVDLSNPAARRWYKEVLAAEMLTAGASGWMADFGEALPFDVLLDSGATGQDYHNRYPEEWARLNRELVEDSASGDELLFFTRSGFTRSPGATTLFWLGDQLVSWDGHDGIKTAVTGLLSSGLSGFALNHSDIGGYTALSSPVLNYHRSKELLLRWMELNAFTAVFRSHEGNQPANSHQIYDDEASLAHFSRFARIYAALAPYRHELMVEAGERGLPLVRHPFIHYPDEERVYTIRYREFMLGPDFLIAPVLDEGVDRISVYLPEGDWVHLWSGQQYLAGPQGLDVEVAAPLGQPGVFYRADSPAARQFQADLQRAGLLQ
ncbi:MAG: alpha-glucosidase, partial [Candidatus Promineifilaceae bacterium]|nr:alpha-glucosidase [Candidatus Promineifilaceae bacterium]